MKWLVVGIGKIAMLSTIILCACIKYELVIFTQITKSKISLEIAVIILWTKCILTVHASYLAIPLALIIVLNTYMASDINFWGNAL